MEIARAAPRLLKAARGTRIDLLFTMSDITRAGLKPRRADLCSRERAQPSIGHAAPSGGARRDRTDDLLLAKQALSQLSYGPIQKIGRQHLVTRTYLVTRTQKALRISTTDRHRAPASGRRTKGPAPFYYRPSMTDH
jgi:hypothetical protein